MPEMEDLIVWAKFSGSIYWPAKIVEDANDKFVYFFDEDTWSSLSRKLKVSDWDCKNKDLFIKKGDQLPDIRKRLSFSRAVKMAEDKHQAVIATKEKSKKGRKRKAEPAVEESTTANLATAATRAVTTKIKTRTGPPSDQFRTPEKKKRGRPKKVVDLNGNSNNSIISHANDDDDDDDEEDLPAAFSPVQKTPDSFRQGDVVWAKYRSCPYYPAVFHSWFSGRKKLQHAWVYFFDETWQIKEMKRTILRIPFRNILHFCCDQEQKDTIMREGESYNSQDFQDADFDKAVKCAEEYLTRKAVGKMDQFFECEAEEEFSDDDDDDDDDETDIERKSDKGKIFFKDLLSKRSKRTSSSNKMIKDLLKAIDNTRPTLIKIYKGEIECERHRIFTSGTTKQKDNLKYRSGYGPIDDDKMAEDLSERLLEWFNNDCRRRENINAVSYISDVWLPEAIILALMNSKKITRNKAEKIYLAR